MSMAWFWLITGGFGVGIVAGLFGVGGGALFVPMLALILGIDIHKAVAISLAVIIPTAVGGTFRNMVAGNVDWMVVLLVAVGSVLGSAVGAGWSLALPEIALRRLFALFLLVLATGMFFSN